MPNETDSRPGGHSEGAWRWGAELDVLLQARRLRGLLTGHGRMTSRRSTRTAGKPDTTDRRAA
jgi:hypothetical protein